MSYKVVASPILYPETIEVRKDIKVLDTHVNLEWLLSHFKTEIRYNLMSRRREIFIPDQFIFPDDLENSALARVQYLSTINGMPIKHLDMHLDTLAYQNSYHPIVECMKQNPWDNIARLDDFTKTIHSTNPELAAETIKTWMVCAMAAAHSQSGFVNNGVLVLQGKQNIGKTRWIKSLDPINCNAVKEGAFLDPKNKDSIIQLASYWIAELGELDSMFSPSAIGRLKSFVTMEFDFVRTPYAIKPIRLARRSVYAATVNDKSYLIDDTGNRRWWTIEVESIDLDHNLNMVQVWAEVYYYWKKGALTYLSPEHQARINETNKEHEKLDPFKEKLLSNYDWSSPARKWLTPTAILEELGYSNVSKSDATRMGKIIKEINGKDGRKSNGYRLHEVPLYKIFPNPKTGY